MTNQTPILRTALATSFLLVVLASAASAQDLYKSRTEMLHAEAANKQANATVITAIALYEKTQAEIARLNQDTREKHATNDLLEAETYYKKRGQYHTYQSSQRPKPEQAKEYVAPARAVSAVRTTAPQQGTPSGAVSWPTLLKTPTYDTICRQIDTLLKYRTPENSGAGSQNCVEIVARIEWLKGTLRENIRRYSSIDYLKARNFVAAIALEAQKPLGEPKVETLDKVAGH